MAKFRYIGDHARGDCLGYQFPRNIGVEITNRVHVTKLQGNPYFEEMRPGKVDPDAAAKAAADEKAKQDAELAELARLEAEEIDAAAKAAADEKSAEAKGDGHKGTNKVAGSK
jgi:hypothetical protein